MSDDYLEGEEKFGYFTTVFYDHIAWHFLSGLYNFSLNSIDILEPKTILDLGAGPGRLSVLIAKKFPDASIYTLDPSPYMVKSEEKNFKKYGMKVNAATGSSRNIPFATNFDLIFTSLSFHHWGDRDNNIKYILSKLSPGGAFVIVEYLNDYYKAGPQKKHSISKQYAESLNFDGFERKISIKKMFIALSFTGIK